MVDDDQVRAVLERLLPVHLERLQRETGLPVVFAGTTHRDPTSSRLVLTTFRGTLSDSLVGLSVGAGRGLGGTVMTRGTACSVKHYAHTHSITHDYDRAVVLDEKLTSVTAHPVKVDGVVRAVIYGAVRAPLLIGDAALCSIGVAVDQLVRGLETTLRTHGSGKADRMSTALEQLGRLGRSVADPQLRAKLLHIHDELAGSAPPALRPASLFLTRREREVLELVAVGRRNREIAPQLGLSPETVKAYLRAAMRKLDVSNRTAAVHTARTLGIL